MKRVKELLSRLIGNENILSNNVLFIDFTGSHEKGQFLSQLFYWSTRSKRKDGWFAKKYEDWYTEIRLKDYSVRRYTKQFTEQGFLETKFKKFNNVPTIHYRLDEDKLIELLLTFCEGDKLLGSHSVRVEGNTELPSRVTQSYPPLTDTTTDITTDKKANVKFAGLEEKKENELNNQPNETLTVATKKEKGKIFSQVTGLKKKIGPKHLDLLEEVATDKPTYLMLRDFYEPGKFDVLMDWLEHKKKIRKGYKSSSGLKELIRLFEDYTYLELNDAVKKSKAQGWQGIFPQKNQKERKQTRAMYDANIAALTPQLRNKRAAV